MRFRRSVHIDVIARVGRGGGGIGSKGSVRFRLKGKCILCTRKRFEGRWRCSARACVCQVSVVGFTIVSEDRKSGADVLRASFGFIFVAKVAIGMKRQHERVIGTS